MREPLRRARYLSVFFVVLACVLLAAAGARLCWLQVFRQLEPGSVAAWRKIPVREVGRRGDLIDARGGTVATSLREVALFVGSRDVVVEAGTRRPRAELADRLARVAGVDPEETLEKFRKADADAVNRWTCLVRGVRDPAVVADLRALRRDPLFRGLALETRWVRDHSRGALFAPLLGWMGWQPTAADAGFDAPRDGEMVGVSGLEERCEAALKATRGRRYVQRDAIARDMVDPELLPIPWRDGRSVRLTLDPIAQQAVESALAVAMEEFEPEWAQVLVLDPRTCDLLAVGQRPAPPDPTPELRPIPADASAAQRAAIEASNAETLRLHQLLMVHRVYPPGSAFKPLMLGLVLDRGVATPDTVVDCGMGHWMFGSRPIRDVHKKGCLDMAGVLVESSNIGMTKYVLSLVPEDSKRGAKAFQPVLDHLSLLGFGHRVGGFAGEENGMVPPLKLMDRNYSLASLAFGQQIQVTALQMATACASLATDGVWRAPRLIDAVEGDDGEWIELPPQPGGERPIFTPATVEVLRGMLGRVVDEGGTRRWKPKGWSMAGKTGTAQDEQHHELSTSSYWCFAPSAAPRFLVMTVLHHPRRGRFAADNAGKVASVLMGELLERFAVPHDRPEELASGPDSARAERSPVATPLAGSERDVVASRAVGEGR